MPVKCLFKGDAAEELKEVAPYLIDMTLPDSAWDDRDQVPAFHKDFFKKHWGKNTGILIRTPAFMADVWKHFRKFTKYQDETGKSFFLSFWRSCVLDSLPRQRRDNDFVRRFVEEYRFIYHSDRSIDGQKLLCLKKSDKS